MATIRDMIPEFELFQPQGLDDAVTLLERYGGDTYREGEASYDANPNTVRNNRLDLKVPANYLAGMSWERPRAPAQERTMGLKLDSSRTSAWKMRGSKR